MTVTDAQLAILADVEQMLTDPAGYTRDEGASQVGFNRRSLEKLLEAGYLRRTDTGDRDTDGGRYRLHPTPEGLEQLRQAVAARRIVVHWLTRAEAEGALL